MAWNFDQRDKVLDGVVNGNYKPTDQERYEIERASRLGDPATRAKAQQAMKELGKRKQPATDGSGESVTIPETSFPHRHPGITAEAHKCSSGMEKL